MLGKGNNSPNMEQQVVLVNGARVPIGKLKYHGNYHEVEENGVKRRIYNYRQHNEYIVYDVSQVRMRYIVQLKSR